MENKRIHILSAEGAGIIVLIILLAIGFVLAHTGQSTKALQAIVETDVEAELSNYEAHIGEGINLVTSTANVVTRVFSEFPDMEDKSKIDFLSASMEAAPIYKAMYCDTEGHAIDQTGTRYFMVKADYFSKLSGTASFYLPVKNDGFGNSNAILYVSPVRKGATKYGYILFYVTGDFIEECLTARPYYNYSFFSILDSDQNVIYETGRATSAEINSGRLWDNIHSHADSNSTWVIFDQKVRSMTKASLYISAGTQKHYIVSTPIEGTSWTLLMATDMHYLSNVVSKLTDPDVVLKIEMILCLVAILIVYIVICLLLNSHARERNKELVGRADTDLLTGASNKIATENYIQKYIADHPNGSGVMILIDLDNFKKINDTMGHAFGDEVLKNLGIRLRSLYRVSDIIGRLGGDEFVVFLKDIADPKIIDREARKLEVFFNGFEVGEYVKYSVTASLGAVVYSKDGRSFEELYKNADHALYEAKHRGKNQMVFFQELEGKNLKSNKEEKAERKAEEEKTSGSAK